MKHSDLFREYARILDMVEGTTIKPCHCIKNTNGQRFQNVPNFLGTPEDYNFAVAIIDNKPVFIERN